MKARKQSFKRKRELVKPNYRREQREITTEREGQLRRIVNAT